MSKTLIIVESPSKCKKIESYLGSLYSCIGTKGHLRSLDLKHIQIDNHFQPTYTILPRQRKQVSVLRDACKKAKKVLLATDDDREGEAIAWHVCMLCNLNVKTTQRIRFGEITKSALQKAISNPGFINMNIVYAQQCRQIIDILIGFKISPILWKEMNIFTLSAGRCQTPTLCLVYDHDKEEDHSEMGYEIQGLFESEQYTLKNDLYSDISEVKRFMHSSIKHKHIFHREKESSFIYEAPKPLTTSRLQQKASTLLHMTPKKTMSICQSLYENGYITYMRTDATFYSKEAIKQINDQIISLFGSDYISNKTFQHQDGAHESIRPTNIQLKILPDSCSSDEKRLYICIWNHTIQSCMADAEGIRIKCKISAPHNLYYYSSFEKLLHFGWKIIDKERIDTSQLGFETIKKREQDCEIHYETIWNNYKLKHTKPHYTEAKLVHAIEKKGIGRPSTYASLVEKNKERAYILKTNVEGKTIEIESCVLSKNQQSIKTKTETVIVGEEKNKLMITSLGKKVVEYVTSHFQELFSYSYTEKMERKLDDIVYKNAIWYEICQEIYDDLMKAMKCVKQNKKQKLSCVVDGKEYIYKQTKYGPTLYDEEEKEYINIKKHMTYDDIQSIIKSNDGDIMRTISLDRRIDDNISIKQGKYGYYIELKDGSRFAIQDTKKAIHKWTKKDIEEYINGKQKGYVRKITNDMSIRNGKYGDYIYYKTDKMKKPKFLSLNKYNGNIRDDDIEDVKDWVQEEHFMQ